VRVICLVKNTEPKTMLTKHELHILESGVIYEELHRIESSTSNQDELTHLMKAKISEFNIDHKTNFNPSTIIENYIKVKGISDFSPLRPKSKRQKNNRKKL
jgi:hypothetical protein